MKLPKPEFTVVFLMCSTSAMITIWIVRQLVSLARELF